MKQVKITFTAGAKREIVKVMDDNTTEVVPVASNINHDFAVNTLMTTYGGCRECYLLVDDSSLVKEIQITATQESLGSNLAPIFLVIGTNMIEDLAMNETALNNFLALT
jgi:hypothetical protein